MLFMYCACHAFVSVHCCLVVTCWERADLLFVMFNCVFVNFPCGILGQVWYLIILIPDLCHFSFFVFIPPANCVCGGYTVFSLSVRP